MYEERMCKDGRFLDGLCQRRGADRVEVEAEMGKTEPFFFFGLYSDEKSAL